MSHVLGLLSHTQGKYELKYNLTTLIYPFTKQRTSSRAKSSREIAWLLVPTDPWGGVANRGWDGTAVGWAVSECGPCGTVDTRRHTCTHTHTNAAACKRCVCVCGSIPPLWGLSSVEDRTRRSSDGSQTEVRAISSGQGVRTWTRGLVHTACGEGGLMGGQRRHMHTGMHMTAAWGLWGGNVFKLGLSDLGALILYVYRLQKGGREAVINGFTVLEFCKAVQGLTGFSMRMAHARGQEWLIILPRTPVRDIIPLLGASLE